MTEVSQSRKGKERVEKKRKEERKEERERGKNQQVFERNKKE